MTTLKILFWISLSVLFYCYIGYGLLVFLFNTIRSSWVVKNKYPLNTEHLPVTLVVAAYNEGSILQQKISNTLAIRYPSDHLKFIFITDGSTDGSELMVKEHPIIRLLHQTERKGKYAAIKRAMREVDTPVVAFSDANSMLNAECIERIITHFADPKVGGVAGEKKIIRNSASALGEAEGLYWQYESLMKRLDADFNTVTGAAGELFAIRTNLFRELDDQLILDDFVISMQVCLQGYRIGYEPGAFAVELPSATVTEEAKRKIRISAGAYQSIGYLKKCLDLFNYPWLGFQYISRRLLRWIFCPFMLFLLTLTNLLIVWKQTDTNFFTIFLLCQAGFYILAFAGWLIINSGKRAGLLTIPFYFVFMNYCLFRGFLKYIRKQHTVLWEKSLRQTGKSVSQ